MNGFTDESGTWALTNAAGIPALARTSNNNTTEYCDIPIVIPTSILANKGAKITSVKIKYSIATADSGDDFQAHVCSRVLPANGSAHAGLATVFGDADADCDSDHNTAAKRVVDTGGPEHHLMTITNPSGTLDEIDVDESWFIRLEAIEADDGTGALAIIVNDIVGYYSIL